MPKPIQAGSGSSGQDRKFSQAGINPSTGARNVAVTEPGAIKIERIGCKKIFRQFQVKIAIK